jgi:hypothetical protein
MCLLDTTAASVTRGHPGRALWGCADVRAWFKQVWSSSNSHGNVQKRQASHAVQFHSEFVYRLSYEQVQRSQRLSHMRKFALLIHIDEWEMDAGTRIQG